MLCFPGPEDKQKRPIPVSLPQIKSFSILLPSGFWPPFNVNMPLLLLYSAYIILYSALTQWESLDEMETMDVGKFHSCKNCTLFHREIEGQAERTIAAITTSSQP